MSFMTGERWFFVMPGVFIPRPGRFGHYLKPYTVDEDKECVPYPPPPGYDANEAKDYENRVVVAGWPGVPWPNKEIVKYVMPRWDEVVDDWIQDSDIPELNRLSDEAGLSKFLIQGYLAVSKGVYRRYADAPFMLFRTLYRANPDNRDLWHPGPPGFKDPGLPPNTDVCVEDEHYVVCDSPLNTGNPKYYEVGTEYLKKTVERGELLDLAFARRMQGLLGVGQDAVWACLDPDFNPADREGALERFAGAYTASFYKAVTWEDQQDARGVAVEALQQHKAFCQVRSALES